MKDFGKKLGVIIGVDGDMSQVGMYSMSNDSQFLWKGEILNGPKVGAFMTIHQNSIKIIATVISEKIIDQQNTIKSSEFDNRYKKNSINRVIFLKAKGVIEENKFKITSQHVPMIGNEITLTTKEELNLIFGFGFLEDSILIGNSLLENNEINLPINKFFASHIGIFGNTGSGKSNTLHKLYLELFNSKHHTNIFEKSQFFVIDFNGEYVGKNIFGIDDAYKQIYNIDTRNFNYGEKLPIEKKYLFNPDILAILFDARAATQVPFLRNALRVFNNKISTAVDFAKMEVGLLKAILIGVKSVSSDALNNWIVAAQNMGINDGLLSGLTGNLHQYNYGSYISKNINNIEIIKDGQITSAGEAILKLQKLESEMKEKYEKSNELQKLSYFLEFQKVYVSAWKSTNIEFINPLFHRIKSAFESMDKVIEIKENVTNEFKSLNIVSLVNANPEVTRLLPMLLSKMIYDNQKSVVSNMKVFQTKHLIIDEAHNILNSEYRNNGDGWQDYRLSIFEEIIKEGRKFGFYLTLSSQRPADISPTIMSQLHNYFIHRLVNEKDLKMLENTMPTLDKYSYQNIPNLGKGEAIITGTAINVPVLVKINKEEVIHPNSDDINLIELWESKKQLDFFDLI
ncbi:ATP-binding protein [Aerococcus agrisoli]|uniref:ATP-binding protein n=1 Tax=Aerococcus agrisoli TaxID=2487350 RepID=A0A3N4GQ99_9LACT|nr:ATP-binding protein [Aerococcus agrisoli]RPA63657.1 ATP-binding protein [Aerococcus agrisoli]